MRWFWVLLIVWGRERRWIGLFDVTGCGEVVDGFVRLLFFILLVNCRDFFVFILGFGDFRLVLSLLLYLDFLLVVLDFLFWLFLFIRVDRRSGILFFDCFRNLLLFLFLDVVFSLEFFLCRRLWFDCFFELIILLWLFSFFFFFRCRRGDLLLCWDFLWCFFEEEEFLCRLLDGDDFRCRLLEEFFLDFFVACRFGDLLLRRFGDLLLCFDDFRIFLFEFFRLLIDIDLEDFFLILILILFEGFLEVVLFLFLEIIVDLDDLGFFFFVFGWAFCLVNIGLFLLMDFLGVGFGFGFVVMFLFDSGLFSLSFFCFILISLEFWDFGTFLARIRIVGFKFILFFVFIMGRGFFLILEEFFDLDIDCVFFIDLVMVADFWRFW